MNEHIQRQKDIYTQREPYKSRQWHSSWASIYTCTRTFPQHQMCITLLSSLFLLSVTFVCPIIFRTSFVHIIASTHYPSPLLIPNSSFPVLKLLSHNRSYPLPISSECYYSFQPRLYPHFLWIHMEKHTHSIRTHTLLHTCCLIFYHPLCIHSHPLLTTHHPHRGECLSSLATQQFCSYSSTTGRKYPQCNRPARWCFHKSCEFR